MPCEVAARFLIFYGSQRGQAQSIAEEICQQAAEHGFTADISCLSNQHKVCFLPITFHGYQIIDSHLSELTDATLPCIPSTTWIVKSGQLFLWFPRPVMVTLQTQLRSL